MNKGPKILLVQDQDLVRETLLLWRSGYEVEIVNDGKAALELLGRQPCDLVITDLSASGTNGTQSVAAIRQALPNVPIILTATLMDGHRVSPEVASGANVLLVKPFSFEQLAAAINQALSKRDRRHRPP